MATLSGLVIGLSFLFSFLFLGFVAELFYLLWWKKRLRNGNRENIEQEDNRTNTSPVFSYLSCWENPKSVNKVKTQGELQKPSLGISSDVTNGHEQDVELGLKGYGEDSVEVELMRLHNLCGPPRFLFTISEETKEDLESDDSKSKGGDDSHRSRKGSRRRKSLGDLLDTLDHTPFLTPLPSPPLKANNLQALDSLNYCYYSNHGFNPLFESSTDYEINKLRSSPPPTFKFLRDAEEKLMKKLEEEAEKKRALQSFQEDPPVNKSISPASVWPNPENLEEGSFIRLINVGKSKEGAENHHQLSLYPSTPSQPHTGRCTSAWVGKIANGEF